MCEVIILLASIYQSVIIDNNLSLQICTYHTFFSPPQNTHDFSVRLYDSHYNFFLNSTSLCELSTSSIPSHHGMSDLIEISLR